LELLGRNGKIRKKGRENRAPLTPQKERSARGTDYMPPEKGNGRSTRGLERASKPANDGKNVIEQEYGEKWPLPSSLTEGRLQSKNVHHGGGF